MRRLPHLSLTQVRLVRLFTLLLVFTVLVLYAVFRSSRFQELLRRRTERLLTAKIGRTVTIGRFDLALVPFAFLVRDVAVANDRRGLPGPAFSASEIELRGLPTITKSRIDIPKLRVVSPRAVVEVFPDGTTNLKAILDSLVGGGGGGIDISLKEAVIQRATLRFREWDAEVDAVLQDAALTARSGRSRSVTHLALACRKGRFRLENNETLDFAIGAEVTLAPGRAHLTGLRLRGDRLKLEASGGVDDLKKPILALVARAETTGETLSKVFGLGLPVTGGITMRGTMRIGEPGGFRIFGAFDLAGAAFGPFPMTGEGVIRVDPKGLLVNVTRASYAGGTLEALVQLERIKNPPLPVRIALRGHGLDFEQFFSDLGLRGTGLIGRADLDTTLTFGRGGIEHADGIGRIRVTADGGRPSAVRGRFALPVSGGGPLEVRDGHLLFAGVSFATAGGARIRVDGGLRLGTWEPDLQLEIASDDLAEVERLADNFYPAIQDEPLKPPLGLGGAGRIAARLSRSFSDPRVEGRLDATNFVLRNVPFGTASAEFLVDRNVATFSPFAATDGGASLSVTGKIGWGGALKGEYRLDGLVAEFGAWPIERVLKFLDLDLPITGAGTGRLPLDGVTPALSGRIPLVLTEASLWGQKLDRLEGVLSFEKDRIAIENTTGRLADGSASARGFYRYADRAFELQLDVQALPVARLEAVQGLPLTGTLSGQVKGSGTVDKPNLDVVAHVADAALSGSPLEREGTQLELRVTANRGVFTLLARAPEAAEITLRPEGTDGGWRGRIDVSSLAPFASLLGLPEDARLDGQVSAEASLSTGKENALQGEGKVSAARVSAYGRTLELRAPASLRVENGKVSLERLTLVELPREDRPPAPPTALTISGSAGLHAPHTLDLSAAGSFDAALLRPALEGMNATGRATVDLKVSGTAAKPALLGRVTLDGVDLTSPGGTAFESITGTLLFSEDRVTALDLSVRYNGGTVDVGGFVALSGVKPTAFRLNAHVGHVRASPFDGFRATFSGDLVLLGDTLLRTVRGDLSLDRAVYSRDFSLDIASLLARKRATVTAGNPTVFDAVALDVRLLAPASSIEVRNNVARLKLSGELFVRGTWGRPLLFGEVTAEEGGRLTLQGQRYEIMSAKILFSNPLRIEPFFELEARGTVSRYQISFGLTGTPSRLVPRFSSDPQLSEAQIVSLMTSGDIPQSAVAGAPVGATPISSDESVSKAARELLASLATSAVTSRTKEFFRLDRFQIDPTITGTSFDAPRVTVGKNLGKDFNATVSFVLSSNQQQIITLDYQLTPAALVQARLDENGIYSIELRIRQRLR
ncbi:MAG TPA: translocation/assembly module TamB domain-containing protein [Thermoanaerobaculia bacterium]|nr:translocation/assembly module TamB domain-containing protein [Thermoanaerobaculia bacterium]